MLGRKEPHCRPSRMLLPSQHEVDEEGSEGHRKQYFPQLGDLCAADQGTKSPLLLNLHWHSILVIRRGWNHVLSTLADVHRMLLILANHLPDFRRHLRQLMNKVDGSLVEEVRQAIKHRQH